MTQYRAIVTDLLKEMLKKRIRNHSYRPIDKIIRFFPSHLHGNVKKVIKKLIRKGILLSFKSGKCVSVNSKYLSSIDEVVEKRL